MDYSIDEWGRLVIGYGLITESIIPILPTDNKRASGWPKFLHGLLVIQPTCIGCGRKAVTGHHNKPFHLFPQYELVESNIAMVCLVCHFAICHGGDWHLYLGDVLPMLAEHLKIVKSAQRM